MSASTVVSQRLEVVRTESRPRLAPYLSEGRWEVLEDDERQPRAFHGAGSRNHPLRRSFRASSGGLLRIALSEGRVRLIVGAADCSDAQALGTEIERYAKRYARAPHEVSLLFEPAHAGRAGWRMDPSRTLGLAHHALDWTSLCIRFDDAPLGLILATEAVLWMRDGSHTAFARLHAGSEAGCLFCGHVPALRGRGASPQLLRVTPLSFQDGYAGVFQQV